MIFIFTSCLYLQGGNNVYQNLLQRLFLTVIPLFGLVRLFLTVQLTLTSWNIEH